MMAAAAFLAQSTQAVELETSLQAYAEADAMVEEPGCDCPLC